MSPSVDERIVEMRFDNAQFEQGVSKSLGTLDRLKSALNLKSASDNLQSIGTAFSGFSVSGAISGLDTVVSRFSALGIMGDQVLRRLTDGFIRLGSRAASAIKSLSVDQIGAGFSKYAQKTEAVQTIMNATGKSIDDVSQVLDKLNVYTDETSYNFTDMVSSIGKFTSAGVDLNVAEDAMEGIANWAATAGVGPAKAASAFYNLSQAISAGAMKMQDWKSINLLNMGTKQFKETAIQTAVELGKLETSQDGLALSAKKTEITYKNFDQTLHEGWLDTDVLLATLSKYADQTTEFGLNAYHAAQEAKTFNDAVEATKDAVSTGWSKTWELVFGNYDEARKLWTDVANEMIEVFAGSAEARNEMLQEWHDAGGYKEALKAVSNAWEGLKGIAGSVKESFREVFPAMTSEKLLGMTKTISNLTQKFADNFATTKKVLTLVKNPNWTKTAESEIVNKNAIKNLQIIKDISKGVASGLSLIGRGFKSVFVGLAPTGNALKNFGGQAIQAAAKAGRFLTELNNSPKAAKFFADTSTKLANLQIKLGKAFTTVYGKLKEFHLDLPSIGKKLKSFGETFASVRDKAKKFGLDIPSIGEKLRNLGASFSSLKDRIKNFTSDFSGIGAKLKEFGSKTLNTIGNAFKNFFKNFDFQKAASALSAGGGAALILLLTSVVKKVNDFIKNFKKDGSINVSKILEPVTDIFEGLSDAISTFTNSIKIDGLKKIATALLMLAGALVILSAIDPSSMTTGLMGLAVLLGELVLATALLGKYVGSFSAGSSKAVLSMIAMAGAVLIMAGALRMISGIDETAMEHSLAAISAMLAGLTIAAASLAQVSKKSSKGIKGLVGMAAAVFIMAGALKMIAGLDETSMEHGLAAVSALLAGLTISAASLSQVSGKMKTSALGLIGIAAAIAILAGVTKSLGSMDTGDLIQGTIAVIALIGALTAFEAITKGSGGISQGLGMLGIAAGIGVLVNSVQELANMDPDALVQGMASVGALMAGIGVLMSYLGNVQGKMGSAGSILVVAASLAILSSVISSIGSLSEGAALQGVAGIGAVLLEIALALNFMKGTVGASAALLVASASILVLAGAISVLSAISPLSMVTALLGLAAAFVIIGAAGFVLGPIAPMILALAGSLAVFGLAVVLAGAGMMLLGAGMTSLAAGMTAGAAAIVASLATLIAGIGVIGASLAGAIALLIASIAGGIASSAVAIASAIGSLVVGVLQVLASAAPAIASAGLQLIVGLINAVSAQIGPLAVAGSMLIINFVNGMAVALNANGPMLIAAVLNLGKAIVNTFLEVLEELVAGIPGIGGKLAQGIESLKMELDTAVGETDLSAGGEAAAASVASGVDAAAPTVEASGQNLGSNLIEGITSSMDGADGIGTTLGASLTSGFDGIGPKMFSSGSGAGTEFISGLLETNPQVQDAGTQLGNSGTEGVDGTEGSWVTSGGFVASGFITGILGKLGDARSAGAQLSTSAKEGADSAVEIASPSKAAMRSGEFFGEGWVIGISSMLRKAMHVGEDLGNAPMDGVFSAVSNLSQLIETGMDANPTITPVLDLSEIRSGMGELRSLTDYSMSLESPSLSMPEQQQQSITPMQIKEFLTLGNAILKEIQNGSDLYFDDGAFAGRINRRLGSL